MAIVGHDPEHDELQRGLHGLPDEGVGEHLVVVGQAHPLGEPVGDVPGREAEGQAADDRHDHEDGEHDQVRPDQQGGGAPVPA